MIKLVAMIAGVVTVGIVGIVAKDTWFRVIAWILSVPCCCLGLMALLQGGLAEKTSASILTWFCIIAFWPILGCTIGHLILTRRTRET